MIPCRLAPAFSANEANRSVAFPNDEPPYESSQLDKFRLSVPGFLGVQRQVRDQVGRAKPDITPRAARLRRFGDQALETALAAELRLRRPRKLAHCVGTLTHRSRVDLLRILPVAGVPGDPGSDRDPQQRVRNALPRG
jgi:hypothetical protein